MTEEKIIDLKAKRHEKIIKDNGFVPERVMLCMNSDQFSELIKQIFKGMKKDEPMNKIMQDNPNLYYMGYLQSDMETVILTNVVK